MRRSLTVCFLSLLVAGNIFAEEPALSRVIFGSGLSAERPQPIWNAVLEARPELFLFLGDAVFLDTDVPDIMKTKYAQLGGSSGFQDLRNTCTVMAVWGGHDYGTTGAGMAFRERGASAKLFREFWEMKNAPAEGVYSARTFGPAGKRVQVILLDTRYFRVPSRKGGDGTATPATLLGDAQWKWFGELLAQPAEMRLIGTPMPLTPGGPGETWADYPQDKEKLEKALKDAKAGGVIFLSGERPGAELCQLETNAAYPYFELTSHGLNIGAKQWRPAGSNPRRISALSHGDNFGAIIIDWARPDPEIRLQGRDVTGDVVFQEKIELSVIHAPGTKPAPAPPPKVVSGTPAPAGGVVTAAEACKKVGEKLTVEFVVKNTGETRDKNRVFLNSSDARDTSNLTIMIDMKKAGDSLQKAGITNPKDHYKNKTIRVTGTVSTFRDAPQIAVEDASQIVVADK